MELPADLRQGLIGRWVSWVVLTTCAVAPTARGAAGPDLTRRGTMGVTAAKRWTFVYRIQCHAAPDRYLRHRDGVVVLGEMRKGEDTGPYLFKMVRGLADPKGVSFESISQPGHYLRHCNFRLLLHRYENSDIYKKDTTFRVRPGLADSGWRSFQSVNFPQFHIMARNNELFIGGGTDATFKRSATFRLVMHGRQSVSGASTASQSAAATYGAQITGVTAPSQIVANKGFFVDVTFTYSFSRGTYAILCIRDSTTKQNIAERKFPLSGAGTQSYRWQFRSPAAPRQWPLQVYVNYWILPQGREAGRWSHSATDWYRNVAISVVPRTVDGRATPAGLVSASIRAEITSLMTRHVRGVESEDLEAAMAPFQPGVVWEGNDHYKKMRYDLYQAFADFTNIDCAIRGMRFKAAKSQVTTTFDYLLTGRDAASGASFSNTLQSQWLWQRGQSGWRVIDTTMTAK